MKEGFTGYYDMDGTPILYGNTVIFDRQLFEVDYNEFGGYPVVDNDQGMCGLDEVHMFLQVIKE